MFVTGDAEAAVCGGRVRHLRAPIERLVVQEFDRIAVDKELLVDE